MAKKLKKSTRYSRMRGPSTCIVLGAYRIVTCIIGLARAYSRLVIVFYFGKGFTVFGFLFFYQLNQLRVSRLIISPSVQKDGCSGHTAILFGGWQLL